MQNDYQFDYYNRNPVTAIKMYFRNKNSNSYLGSCNINYFLRKIRKSVGKVMTCADMTVAFPFAISFKDSRRFAHNQHNFL